MSAHPITNAKAALSTLYTCITNSTGIKKDEIKDEVHVITSLNYADEPTKVKATEGPTKLQETLSFKKAMQNLKNFKDKKTTEYEIKTLGKLIYDPKNDNYSFKNERDVIIMTLAQLRNHMVDIEQRFTIPNTCISEYASGNPIGTLEYAECSTIFTYDATIDGAKKSLSVLTLFSILIIPDSQNYNIATTTTGNIDIDIEDKTLTRVLTVMAGTAKSTLETRLILFCDTRSVVRSPAMTDYRKALTEMASEDVGETIRAFAFATSCFLEALGEHIMTVVLTKGDDNKWLPQVEPMVVTLREFINPEKTVTTSNNGLLLMMSEIIDEISSRVSNGTLPMLHLNGVYQRIKMLSQDESLMEKIHATFGTKLYIQDAPLRPLHEAICEIDELAYNGTKLETEDTIAVTFLARILANGQRNSTLVRIMSATAMEQAATLIRISRRFQGAAGQDHATIATAVETYYTTVNKKTTHTAVVMSHTPASGLMAALRHLLGSPSIAYHSAIEQCSVSQGQIVEQDTFRTIATSSRHMISLSTSTKSSYVLTIIKNLVGRPLIDTSSIIYYDVEDICDKGVARRNLAAIEAIKELGLLTKQASVMLLTLMKSPRLIFPSVQANGISVYRELSNSFQDDALSALADTGSMPANLINNSGCTHMVTPTELATNYEVQDPLDKDTVLQGSTFHGVVICTTMTDTLVKDCIKALCLANKNQLKQIFAEFLNKGTVDYYLITTRSIDNGGSAIVRGIKLMTPAARTVTEEDVAKLSRNQTLHFLTRVTNTLEMLKNSNNESYLNMCSVMQNIACHRTATPQVQTAAGSLVSFGRLIHSLILLKTATLRRYDFGGKHYQEQKKKALMAPAIVDKTE